MIKLLLPLLVLGWLTPPPAASAAQPVPSSTDQGISALLDAVERVAAGGRPAAYLELLASGADRDGALKFADENFGARIDRAAIRERDRQPLGPAAAGYRLVVAALLQVGNQGRLLTWELDVRPQAPAFEHAAGSANDGRWLVAGQRSLGALENLHRLAIEPRQFAARNLVLAFEDLELRLPAGSVFMASTGTDPTALVLLGRGEVVFSPAPAAERGQVEIFAGSDQLRTAFDACLIRLNPSDLPANLRRALTDRPPDASDVARAQQLFSADIGRSYTLDVGDLSPGPWSLVPASGDVVAEIHTRRFGQLTYARTKNEPEDVALFDRLRRRTISLYASREKLAARGPFFDEDGQADYAITHYDVTAAFAPERHWIEGRTRLILEVRAASLTTLSLRLADGLAVRSAVAEGLGRMAPVRVGGQDTVLLTLPATLARGTRLALSIAYSGKLPPLARPHTPGATEQSNARNRPRAMLEPSLIYTPPIAWYVQAPTSSYATATLRLTVPAPYSCAASGQLVTTSAVAGTGSQAAQATSFNFTVNRPVPYLACLITRLVPQAREDRASPELSVLANPGQQGQARQVGRTAAEILRFYTSLVGDQPYPALTVALISGALPSGISPAYLAVITQQIAMSPLVWRDDPSAFPDFPEFFVAHEVAHQWWGQAVGPKNYHEQWLSEAFAQYFAALYAEHAHGPRAFLGMMKRMADWAERSSGEGPVYLGSRVGQLRNDGRLFRAVVYDKGAVILHMLRRLVGDAAFFDGLRRFYSAWRFKKAGTDDLRQAIEAASGVRLQRFFERWVYADALPRVKYSWRMAPGADGEELVVRFGQEGDVFDFPVLVTIERDDGPPLEIVVDVTDRVVERRVVPGGRVRNVVVDRDELVPAKWLRE